MGDGVPGAEVFEDDVEEGAEVGDIQVEEASEGGGPPVPGRLPQAAGGLEGGEDTADGGGADVSAAAAQQGGQLVLAVPGGLLPELVDRRHQRRGPAGLPAAVWGARVGR